MHRSILLAVLLAVCLGSGRLWAGDTVLEAANRGWVSNVSNANDGAGPTNSYQAGTQSGLIQYNWFQFHIPALLGNLRSATLELDQRGKSGDGTLVVYRLTGQPSTVGDFNSMLPMPDHRYGSTLTSDVSPIRINLDLNNAVREIAAAAGGDVFIGGKLLPQSANGSVQNFAGTGATEHVRLILTTEPFGPRVLTTVMSPIDETVHLFRSRVAEPVPVHGHAVTITEITPPDPSCTVQNPCLSVFHVKSLINATGVGATSGQHYEVKGNADVTGTFNIPGPFVFNTPLFLVRPNLVVPPDPLAFAVTLVSVDSQGNATGASSPPTGLVSWWKGEANAADALGANPGALNGPVAFVPGRVGGAFHFGALNSLDQLFNGVVEVPASSTLQPASVTAMAWVRNQGFPGVHNHVLSQGANQCIAASYALYAELTGLRFYIFGDGGYVESPAATDQQVWDGNWHLVAGTYDGATVRMYLDGAEVGSGTPSQQHILYALPDNQNFYIGGYRGQCTLGFQGDVDEVRIFNRALSAAEIHGIYLSTP